MKRALAGRAIVATGLLLLLSWPRPLIAENQRPDPALPSTSLTELNPAAEAAVEEAFGGLPLRFEANLGQTDDRVKFLSRGRGYTLFLTPAEAVMALRPATSDDQLPAVLRWSLAGADHNAPVRGLDELPGKSNYFIGNDPKAWRTDVPTYGKVAYDNVYPGIDLVYYGNQNRLEYDFVVAPGADPKAVQLAFEGASPRLDSSGDLTLATGDGEVRLKKPQIYQEMGGVRRPVPGGYLVQSEGAQVGFRIAAYDSSLPLIIDPVLEYSTYLGGIGADAGSGIVMGPDGSVYVTGRTDSGAAFPGPGGNLPTQVGPAGSRDAFVVKLNNAGTAILYSTYFGGTGLDVGGAIAIDGLERAHVTGGTISSDFPTTLEAFDTQYNGGVIGDAFLMTLDPNGSLVYSTYLGGHNNDTGTGIVTGEVYATASGPQADVYITGFTSSGNFPTKNAFQTAFVGGAGLGGLVPPDAFVVKLTPATVPVNAACLINGKTYNDCDDLLYSTYLGGKGVDTGRGIAVRPLTNSVFVTGQTCSTDFPATSKAFAMSLNGSCDAFMARVDPGMAGQAVLAYATYLGGSGSDRGHGIALNGLSEVFVTGETQSVDFPTKGGPFQPQHGGGAEDVFLTRLAADSVNTNAGCTISLLPYNDCADLRYSTFLGGSGDDFGRGVAVDIIGAPYVTGQTCSSNFPLMGALPQDVALGINVGAGCDAFVTKLKFDGSALLFSTYLGGSNADTGAAVLVDVFGNAYVAGSTDSTNLPTQAPLQAGAAGGGDAFVAKVISTPCVGAGGPIAYTGNGGMIDTANDCLLPDKVPGGLVVGGNEGMTSGAIAVRPDGAKVYGVADKFMDPPTNALVFDTATKTVTKVPVAPDGLKGGGAMAVAVTPDGTQLFVTVHEDTLTSGVNANSSNVYVINTATNTLTDTIPASDGGHNFDGVAVHPDGTRVYVSQFEKHFVQVINTQTKALDPTAINLGNANATALAMTPDGKWLYVGNRSGDPVAVIDVDQSSAGYHTKGDIPVGGSPLGVAVSPRPVPPYGHLVYVATGGFVAVIDSLSKAVVVPAVPGAAGNAVAATPDGKKVYVTGPAPFVQVIDVDTNVVADFKVVNAVLGAGGGAVTIGPQDRDVDGIIDQIDGTYDAAFVPDTAASDGFTDKHLGGTSSGIIAARNGLKVTVWEAFNPAGFYANARGGAGTAEIKACGQLADQSDGQPISLTANDVVKSVCGSLTLDVIQGPVEVGLGGGTQAVVPTGGAIKVTHVSPGQFQVDNLGNTPITVVNAQGNVLALVSPGQSFTTDTVPPEAYIQFDPASKALLVFGRDALSGVLPGPIAPSVTQVKWGKEDDEEGAEGNAELRTYRIADAAGNVLMLVQKVNSQGHEIKARVVSLQYNGGPMVTPPSNTEKFEWSTERDGTLRELEQRLEVGKGRERQKVEAKFEAKKNETTIKAGEPKPERKVVKSGLALLRLATRDGGLVIEFDP